MSIRFQLKFKDSFIIERDKKKYLILKNDSISRKLYISGKYGDKKIKAAAEILIDRGFSFEYLINVGANIGTTIIQFSDFGFKRGLGFEPNPKAFSLLSNNLELNNLGDFKVLEIALGGEAGIVHITNSQNLGTNFVEHSSNSNTIQVESRTLDNILNDLAVPLERNSTLLWMDVQGYELEVLRGAQNFIESGCPIVLEFWPHELRKYNEAPDFGKIFNGYSRYYILSDKPPIALPLASLASVFESMKGSMRFTDILVV